MEKLAHRCSSYNHLLDWYFSRVFDHFTFIYLRFVSDHSQNSNFEWNHGWYSKNSQIYLRFDLEWIHDPYWAIQLSIHHSHHWVSACPAFTTNYNGFFNFSFFFNPSYLSHLYDDFSLWIIEPTLSSLFLFSYYPFHQSTFHHYHHLKLQF